MTQAVFRILALVALVAIIPILLGIGFILLLIQGRPVIFRQLRSGLNRQTFWLVKFRTMNDRRGSDGQLLPDLERTTSVGRFLRFTRLDELPGLWNMVKGDMALVGPRPLLPHTVEDLGQLGARRGAVRPGITGWAQINGNTLLSLQQKVALDLWYIENRTLGLDVRILIKTLGVALGGERLNSDAVDVARSENSYRDD